MKKLFVFLIALLMLVSAFSVASFADEAEPSIRASGVSIRIPEGSTKGGLRFKMTVETPLPEGIEIIEEGTVIIPLHAIGGSYVVYAYRNSKTGYQKDELTLSTPNILKVVKSENKYYSYEDGYYEFTAVLTGIPVYSLKSEICARGYITYTLNGGEEKTVYSDTVIYDIYSIAEKMVASNKETQSNKDAVETFILDAHDEYSTTDGGNAEGLLSITAPAKDETVYPYYSEAVGYVTGTNKSKSWYVIDSVTPIVVSWSNRYSNVASFTVLYATKEDFSDAKYAFASASSSSVNLYNLYKATDYYVKVIANLKDGTTRSVTSTFKMPEVGPRTIKVDGSYNMRDLGGYMTESGKRTLQGLIYRSGQFDSTFNALDSLVNAGVYPQKAMSTALTYYGKHVIKNELGIKTELDFRPNFTAAIPGVPRLYVGLNAYRLADASNQEKIREIFSILANIDNYPIVFHCQGGADRTGTVAYLFNALLGVPEADVNSDYEFTRFSIYGGRSITATDYIAKPSYAFFTTLDAQEGDTLQKRVENYLLSIGVTAEEIFNIKSIMFTGEIKRTMTCPDEFKLVDSSKLTIGINAVTSEITDVRIGGYSVEWTSPAGGTIAISAEEFSSVLENGEVTVEVEFIDGEVLSGSFIYDNTRSIEAKSNASVAFNEHLTVMLGAAKEQLSAVYVAGQAVEYTIDENNIITVLSKDIPNSAVNGTNTVKVVLTDGEELTDTFEYDKAELVPIEDLLEKTTLKGENLSVVSSPVGYGKWVRIRMDATNGDKGAIKIFIGSYGLYFRSSETRYHTLSASGVDTQFKSSTGHNLNKTYFTAGNNRYIYVKVDLVNDTTAKMSIVTKNRTTGANEYAPLSYNITRLSGADEISDANACVTFKIDGMSDGTYELVIYGAEPEPSSATFPNSVSATDEKMDIAVSAKNASVLSVYIADTSVPFTVTETGVSVLVSDLPLGIAGQTSAKVVLSSGEELEGSFIYVLDRSIDAIDSKITLAFNHSLTVTFDGLAEHVSAVYVADEAVEYTISNNVITVLAEDMPDTVVSGMNTVKVVFTDSGEATDTFECDATEMVPIEDLLEKTTLKGENLSVVSSPVGYGKWVRIRMDASNGTTGAIKVFVGSYGIYFRSSETRYHTLSASGVDTQFKSNTGHSLNKANFGVGNNYYLYIRVDLVNDTTARVYSVAATRSTGQVYLYQTFDVTRLSGENEISDADARVTFKIDGKSDGTSELVIYGAEPETIQVTFPDSVDETDEKMDIEVTTQRSTVSSVIIAGNSVPFTVTETGVSVLVSDLPSGIAGQTSAKVVLSSGKEVEGSFNFTTVTVYNADDYFDFGDSDTITVAHGDPAVSTTTAIGYGEWVRIRCDYVLSQRNYGHHFVFIGSYGVGVRGYSLRYHTLDASGTNSEKARVNDPAGALVTSNSVISSDNDLMIKVEIISETEVEVHLKTVNRTTNVQSGEQVYTMNRLTSGEISSEDAAVTVVIGPSGKAGDSMIIKKQ